MFSASAESVEHVSCFPFLVGRKVSWSQAGASGFVFPQQCSKRENSVLPQRDLTTLLAGDTAGSHLYPNHLVKLVLGE